MTGTKRSIRGDLPETDGNVTIARRLEEVAALLEEQGASPFRVRAYRDGAETLRRLPTPVAKIVRLEGETGLQRLPRIGERLARAIAGIVRTGRFGMLERLRGEADPLRLLMSVPGIGKRLAARLYEDLGIETLEELESAAHDGRLSSVEGLGTKRVAGIEDSLAGRLASVRFPQSPSLGLPPPTEELLDVDREYRARAAAGSLPKIVPRRFNVGRVRWLPILQTERGDRHYTALFSNTARAHELGKTNDWVILYHDGAGSEGQHTVVTEARGPLEGQRVVRGREEECARHSQGRTPTVA